MFQQVEKSSPAFFMEKKVGPDIHVQKSHPKTIPILSPVFGNAVIWL